MFEAAPDLNFQFKNWTAKGQGAQRISEVKLFLGVEGFMAWHCLHCLCWAGLACVGARKFVLLPQSSCWSQKDFDYGKVWELASIGQGA